MREIKFRGLYKNTWVVGSLILGKSLTSIDFAQIENTDANNFRIWDVDLNSIGQFTGQKDSIEREVYELDIYSEMDECRKFLYVVTWINEYSAFAMLTPDEFNEYEKIGIKVIEESFEGFYVQLHRDSFQKMKYEGNTIENPELLK